MELTQYTINLNNKGTFNKKITFDHIEKLEDDKLLLFYVGLKHIATLNLHTNEFFTD